MNTFKIRLWFLCQRWKSKVARWRRAYRRRRVHPRFEQLRLPFD
jgi:hypothetical protein